MWDTREPGSCVIEVVRASNLPNMDIVSLTDCYVVFSFREVREVGGSSKVGANALGGVSYRTLTCNNNLNPVFGTYKEFPYIPKSTDTLLLELYDEDVPGFPGESIGSATVTYSALASTKGEIDLNIKLKTSHRNKTDRPETTITVRKVFAGTLESDEKEIFVVRHGESKWNEAQHDKDVSGLVKQFDHELTSKGLDQAAKFNAKWKQELDAVKDNDDLACFLSATKIFSSPLTRAIETALVTCEGHSSLQQNGLILLRNLREQKNIGSFDTVGKFHGDDIEVHVRKVFSDEFGGDDGEGERVNSLMAPIDYNYATGQWWTRLEVAERKKDVINRWDHLFNRLRYGYVNDKVIILVGHSHFFRAMCQEYISEGYRNEEPKWTAELERGKLDNASCMRCTIKWEKRGTKSFENLNTPPVITKCKLVFGSKIVHG